jgi:hypothetical protein
MPLVSDTARSAPTSGIAALAAFGVTARRFRQGRVGFPQPWRPSFDNLKIGQ